MNFHYVYCSVLVLLFCPIFFIMGYRAAWRWFGVICFFYIFLVSFITIGAHNLSAAVYILSFSLPFISFACGAVPYRQKNGRWPESKTTRQIRDSAWISPEENNPGIIWMAEQHLVSIRGIKKAAPWVLLPGFLLTGFAALPSTSFSLYNISILSAVLAGIFLLVVFIHMNRIRYRYGITPEAFGISMEDPIMRFTSSASVAGGSMDSNPTLAGAGFMGISINKIKIPWPEGGTVEFDDTYHEVRIKHGWRGTGGYRGTGVSIVLKTCIRR